MCLVAGKKSNGISTWNKYLRISRDDEDDSEINSNNGREAVVTNCRAPCCQLKNEQAVPRNREWPKPSAETKPKTKTPGAKLATKPAASVKTDVMATKVAAPVKSGTSSIRSTAATKAPLTGQSAVKKAPAGTIATPSVVEPLRTVIVGPVLRRKS